MEVLGYLLTGAAAAAVIKLIDNVILWHLNRKASKEDKSEQRAEAAKAGEDKWKKDTEDSINGLKDGLRIIMLDRIRYLGQRYLKDGEIDFDDRRYLNEMHQVYHNSLGGNGDLNALMGDVNDLPLKQR